MNLYKVEVDDLDADIFYSYETAMGAVEYALENGAKRVTITVGVL